jgi:signal transduction histidine kinase
MKLAVRHSLLAVAVLGAVTAVAAVYMLWRLVSTGTAQRLERNRDLITQQLAAQRTADAGTRHLTAPVAITSPRLGVRGGFLPRDATVASITPPLDEVPRALLERTLREAHTSTDGLPDVQAARDDDRDVLAGSVLTLSGDLAWAVHVMKPPPGYMVFRVLVITLGLAGLALVIASAQLAFSMSRGARLLRESLRSLGHDLSAPIHRPAVRELSEVADGIDGLAAELRKSQTEQARLSRELAEGERMASLGRVAAGVAHEVRNPLAAIKLRVDLASMDPTMPTSLGNELAGVSAEITRLDRLVSDLLVIAGRKPAAREHADLRALVEQRAAVAEAWAHERNVTIHVQGSASADIAPDAIGRAIDNLIRNAVEASPPGAAVEVALGVDTQAVTLAVSDRGQGVAPARVGELFEPFFTTKPDGVGLGLALSKAIAKAHGGVLTYRREGDVTRFELRVPVEGDAGATAHEAPAS